jgi:hypothetical protein
MKDGMLLGLRVADDTTRTLLSLYSTVTAVPRTAPGPGDVDETLSGSALFVLDHKLPASSLNWIRARGEALDSNE